MMSHCPTVLTNFTLALIVTTIVNRHQHCAMMISLHSWSLTMMLDIPFISWMHTRRQDPMVLLHVYLNYVTPRWQRFSQKSLTGHFVSALSHHVLRKLLIYPFLRQIPFPA
ncbi:hypothetical protein HOLleu_43012 [Holothuria leucospilota]|uniref:Uncharacterized protein n=1 Tax=Holothuria leucospilota TaxID=206669 RepID=A0A9Q0Y9V7_HOLLE|nr:hypothetical protein HOLleu_43012 [Holothuria leucospilota]